MYEDDVFNGYGVVIALKNEDSFLKIKDHPAYQTDSLSHQFFSWMEESDPGMVDQYKSAIFKNTRAILNLVPAELKPDEGRKVCVCSFEDGVKTPFIDIMVDLKEEGEETEKMSELVLFIQKRFFEIFAEKGKLVYQRGSFGFAHPNITWIDPKMRINPGIDPSEVVLYQQFFQELAEEIRRIQ